MAEAERERCRGIRELRNRGIGLDTVLNMSKPRGASAPLESIPAIALGFIASASCPAAGSYFDGYDNFTSAVRRRLSIDLTVRR
jgi:hypothetical protein